MAGLGFGRGTDEDTARDGGVLGTAMHVKLHQQKPTVPLFPHPLWLPRALGGKDLFLRLVSKAPRTGPACQLCPARHLYFRPVNLAVL